MTRRDFLTRAGLGMAALSATGGLGGWRAAPAGRPVSLFLTGDVMTGRGIDQLLAHPSAPGLHEPYVRDARRYVALAEAAHGRIARPVPDDYIWGDALAEMARRRPELRIVNLETAVTTSDEPWLGKGIHYRMHPANVGCLTAAAVDCCVLANNHVLDWGRGGLVETLETLRRAGMATAGAGRDLAQAEAPAVLPAGGRRVLVFALGAETSGIPREWAATPDRPGLSLLTDLSSATVKRLARRISASRRSGDLAVVSIHWGPNWGYEVPAEHRRFARRLVDEAGADAVHGHSSHHAMGIEVHRGRPILYGCGDFINDYEGIGGHEEYRGDLALGYFASFSAEDGALEALTMVPFQSRKLRLGRISAADLGWLHRRLDRECGALGTAVEQHADGSLGLAWTASVSRPS